MYKAYVSQSKELWVKSVSAFENEAKLSPASTEKQFNLAVAQYGLLLGTMASQDEDLFDEYVSKTKDQLEKVISYPATAADGKGMLSAVMGLQMAYSPMKGITLGSKSGSLAAEAKNLAPDSPLAWRFYGSNKLYTPSTFGGDVKEAISALEKSIKLFESKLEQTKNNWLYLDTIVLLGQAYSKNDEKPKAIATYKKAIGIEHQFMYAKLLLAKAEK
ncbi:MAG: hypothetical protein K2U26_00110 [Cyclobacteriaceae bacterium]|nr:hypothetical protein [Cyclobacteriaceae bacterium]